MGYYSFNRPRRDGRLSWPCWLTDSGRLTHKVVKRPSLSLAQDRESSPAKTDVLTTMLLQSRAEVQLKHEKNYSKKFLFYSVQRKFNMLSIFAILNNGKLTSPNLTYNSFLFLQAYIITHSRLTVCLQTLFISAGANYYTRIRRM